jgi:hypothetical protein
MQDQPIDAGLDSAPPTARQDLKDQAVVLTHVLAVHPDHLIVSELVREIAAGIADFAEDDRMERAVRDLTGLGLLRCPGGIVVPTRAAIRFNELLGG